MHQLKHSSNIYIGFRHYIIAGLAVPILFGILASILLNYILQLSLGQYEPTIINLIGILLGTIYSARYLKRTFIITNPETIVRYSIAWFIIIQAVFTLLPYILSSVSPLFTYPLFLAYGGNNYFSFYSVVITLLEIILLYFVSKKYITIN